jgi:hypothetical protein
MKRLKLLFYVSFTAGSAVLSVNIAGNGSSRNSKFQAGLVRFLPLEQHAATAAHL